MAAMVTPNEQHHRLKALAGEWVGEETLSASPWGPGGQATGKVSARVDLDGFFVLWDYVEERNGKPTFRGHGVFAWDNEQRDYAFFWFDSMGYVQTGPSRGSFEWDTLVFTRVLPRGQTRHTFRFTDPSTYRMTIENSFDGGATWTQFLEGVYRKQGR